MSCHYCFGPLVQGTCSLKMGSKAFKKSRNSVHQVEQLNDKIGKELNSKGKVQVFCDFCGSTSLHGYSYLQNSKSKLMKLFWAIGILTMTGIGIGFSYINTNEYLNSRLTTTIESSTASLDVSMIDRNDRSK